MKNKIEKNLFVVKKIIKLKSCILYRLKSCILYRLKRCILYRLKGCILYRLRCILYRLKEGIPYKFKAELTVEAAFIIPILTALILFAVYMNFYLRDEVIIASKLCIYTNAINESKNEEIFKKELEETLWITKILDTNINNKNSSITVNYNMSFNGLITSVFGIKFLEGKRELKREYLNLAEIRRFISVGKDAIMHFPAAEKLLSEWITLE